MLLLDHTLLPCVRLKEDGLKKLLQVRRRRRRRAALLTINTLEHRRHSCFVQVGDSLGHKCRRPLLAIVSKLRPSAEQKAKKAQQAKDAKKKKDDDVDQDEDDNDENEPPAKEEEKKTPSKRRVRRSS